MHDFSCSGAESVVSLSYFSPAHPAGPTIKIYLIACRRCGPFSHSNHPSWLVVVVGFRHAIMQISTAPLAIALAIYTV